MALSLQTDFGQAVSPIRTAGGLETNPGTALSHCRPDFFCSAYCQDVRQAAVSCVRLSLQEAVSNRYTEISEVYSEQQLGREDFLAFCADPSFLIHTRFSTKLLLSEKSNIITQYSVMSLGCLLNQISDDWNTKTSVKVTDMDNYKP